jgi:hypothetical protein
VGVSIASERGARPRGEPRVKIFQLASLRIDGAALRAHILDISPSGARIHCAVALRHGQRTTLLVEHLHIAATVLWTRDQRAGLRFDTRLTDDQLRRISALD